MGCACNEHGHIKIEISKIYIHVVKCSTLKGGYIEFVYTTLLRQLSADALYASEDYLVIFDGIDMTDRGCRINSAGIGAFTNLF